MTNCDEVILHLLESSKTCDGRREMFLKFNYENFSEVIGLESLFSPENVEISVSFFRAMRNSCVDSYENALFIMRSNILVYSSLIVRKLILDQGIGSDKIGQVSLALVQFASNFVANGKEFVSYLWYENNSELEFGSIIRDFLAFSERCRNRKSLGAIVGLILISIRKSDELFLNKICRSRSLLCQVLMASSSKDLSSAGDGSNDPLNEWFHLLAVHLLCSNKWNEIFSAIQPTDQISQICNYSFEQVILLQIFIGVVEDNTLYRHIEQERCIENVAECLIGLIVRLGHMLTPLKQFTQDLFTTENIQNPKNDECVDLSDRDKLIEDNLLLSSLSVSLEFMASSMAFLHNYCDPLTHLLRFSGFQSPLLELEFPIWLGYLLPDFQVNQNRSDKDSLISSITHQMTYNALRILANVVYHYPLAQSKYREWGLLVKIASKCYTDVKHPLHREWSSIGLKYCCADCVENVNYLQELQLQDVILDESLKAKGLSAVIEGSEVKIEINRPNE